MKKLLLILMVVALASFLFVGCLPGVVADEDEDENGVVTEVTVEIEDAAVVDGKTYVSGGAHDITITFPAPVVGSVTALLGTCTGDYTKTLLEDLLLLGGTSVVLFPDTDRKVWSGSAEFGYYEGCCASYLLVTSGECEDEICIKLPVIVDSCYPFAEIEWEVENCPCEDCEITFTSTISETECPAAEEECCDDSCSGFDSWSITLYDEDPFDVCCDPDICEVPIDSGSGTCPISFTTTECLAEGGPYYAVIKLVDNVLLETTYYAVFDVVGGTSTTDTCDIVMYSTTKLEPFEPPCIVWDTGDEVSTIGACVEECMDEVE